MSTCDAIPQPSENSAPTPCANNRQGEIDEVMDFLRFSVKPSSSFTGTILFKFQNEDSVGDSSYLVNVSESKEVTTLKNGTAADVDSVTCEVSISVDDFLWLYSGKASSADLVKMFYAGRVSISGYAFRKVSSFAQSFDFSTDKWTKFYAHQERAVEDRHRSPDAREDGNSMGPAARDFWLFYCRALMERQNISKLQRITWESSLSSMFGEQFVIDTLRRSTQAQRRTALLPTRQGEFDGLVAGMKGLQVPSSQVQCKLAHLLQPCARIPAHVVPTANGEYDGRNIFDFFSAEYVDAVKQSAKWRYIRAQRKDRVDLADVGMDQLDKLLVALGKSGHSNKHSKTKAKYVPAPELLLREFQTQTMSVMNALKEKAVGHQSVDCIPAPDTAWLHGAESGLFVSTGEEGGEAHTELAQALVIVDRSQIQRRGSKRNFAVPKRKIKAKLESLSRDLAERNRNIGTLSIDEHLIFSDYV